MRKLDDRLESERRYIARELHDEAGQALTALMLRLGMLERDLQRGEPVADRVAELKHTLEMGSRASRSRAATRSHSTR